MKLSPVENMLIGIAGAFLVRAAWDYWQSGRAEKGIYMKVTDCEKSKEKCCVSQIKKDVATQGVRLNAVEKRLDQGSQDFRLIHKAIGGIKEDIAGMTALLKKMTK
ncbi:MAG: hypothetical protein MI862_05325 [Desulfobacterales bacterium]|nr:hypothetical protein [Desulfobacterales bacterium]